PVLPVALSLLYSLPHLLLTVPATFLLYSLSLHDALPISPVFNQDHRSDQLAAFPQVQELWQLPNVILTPHIAFFTNIAVQNMVDIALDDVLAILADQPVANEVK